MISTGTSISIYTREEEVWEGLDTFESGRRRHASLFVGLNLARDAYTSARLLPAAAVFSNQGWTRFCPLSFALRRGYASILRSRLNASCECSFTQVGEGDSITKKSRSTCWCKRRALYRVVPCRIFFFIISCCFFSPFRNVLTRRQDGRFPLRCCNGPSHFYRYEYTHSNVCLRRRRR